MSQFKGRSNVFYFTLGLAVFVFAAFVRSAYLSHFPPQIHNDEASTVTRGFRLVSEWTLSKIFSGSEFGGHPSFGFWLASLPSAFFGEESTWTLRLSSAVIGTLSLLFFTLFVGRAYGARVALVSLMVCAPFHLHVHYSRTGFIYIHAVLMAAVVSYAFVRFLQRASAVWAFLTGLSMGLAMLVYPATQVLPIGMIAAVVLGVLPATASTRVLLASPKRFLLLTLCGILGGLVTFGAQLNHIISHGYLSRLNSTYILQPHNIKHLSSVMKVQNPSNLEVTWFNILQTLKFFYASDSGEQYNFTWSPLPIWMGVFAILGFGILVARSFKREPSSIYIVSIALATFFASAMMVEGNFSPHLVIFSLLLPLFCAIGIDSAVSRARGLQGWAVNLILIGGLALWSYWNWGYYNKVINPLRPRIATIETRFLNLPIDNLAVKRFVNLSTYDIKFDESHIELVYPNGSESVVAAGSPLERAGAMELERSGAMLVLVDLSAVEQVTDLLSKRGAVVSRYDYPGVPLSFIHLRMNKE
jgi:4-amino-4-deoxy-L-arabinose transferase-like glycosyltransferase